MQALVLTPATRSASVQEIPIPTPGPGEVLIRVRAVAINPVDQIYFAEPIAAQAQRVLGVDFAGEVVGRHADLKNSSDKRVKIGERVAGFVQGANSVNDRPGAFAQYVVSPHDLLWTIPSTLLYEQASTVSMCALTVAQALFPRFGLPSPFWNSQVPIPHDEDETINMLIYGSSSSLGFYGAQLVHLAAQASGRRIRLIGTASSRKHALLSAEPYGYDVLLDYRDPEWPAKVRDATGGVGVHYALDTISERDTVGKVHSTLYKHGKYHVFRSPSGGQYNTSDAAIQPAYGTVWEGLGHVIDYGDGHVFSAPPESREFAIKFYEFLSSAVDGGKVALEPNPVRKMPGGLERIVPDAFALLSGLVSDRRDKDRQGQDDHSRPISGEKLVYSID
ncbi:chaperonin 10-like protein [Aspergillus pseudoustus]|uniref:Chaperonin 10-like protein n=1 Tax=Aspergillus pseudoustus TaxID=1810923 RepID=A0ABR4J5Z5_9EURO